MSAVPRASAAASSAATRYPLRRASFGLGGVRAGAPVQLAGGHIFWVCRSGSNGPLAARPSGTILSFGVQLSSHLAPLVSSAGSQAKRAGRAALAQKWLPGLWRGSAALGCCQCAGRQAAAVCPVMRQAVRVSPGWCGLGCAPSYPAARS